jgi:hypothetical protein
MLQRNYVEQYGFGAAMQSSHNLASNAAIVLLKL